MKDYLYIEQETRENPLIRKILIVLLLLALVSGLVIGGFVYFNSVNIDQRQADFETALDEQAYDSAILIYRQIREKATNTRLSQREQERYQEALIELDAQTDQMITAIEEKMIAGDQLSDDEIAMIEGLSELAAARMITRIRELTRNYLLGVIQRKPVTNALNQLGSIDAIAQGVSHIPEELDKIGLIRSSVSEATQAIQEGAYWTGYEQLEILLADDTLGLFTREQLSVLMETCQEEMYDPLIDQAKALIDGGRYLSAHSALQKIQEVYPDDLFVQQAIAQCEPHLPDQLISFEGQVEFITIKPLINQPERAFDGDAYASAARDSMLTTTEFQAMLEALHANDYILVDADRLYDKNAKIQTLFIPPDKKPLVIVLEGLNYYVTRRETGNAWNLVFDEGGAVAATYVDEAGNRVVSRTAEAIGILDLFVQEHPDFSLDGAKGTISLTGYECVFGYVTDNDQLDDRNAALEAHGYPILQMSESEIEDNRSTVQQLMNQLKRTGWLFASSTYGFIQARDHDLQRIRTDTEKWLSQVGSLTGPVSMLHYPNGAFINGSDERAVYLKDQGFILFGGIGGFPYLYSGDRYLYVDKVPVNGYTLQNSSQFQLDRFFDAASIYDSESRKN